MKTPLRVLGVVKTSYQEIENGHKPVLLFMLMESVDYVNTQVMTSKWFSDRNEVYVWKLGKEC